MNGNFDDILADLAPIPLSMVEQEVSDAVRQLAPAADGIFAKYRNDPVGYARDVLKVNPWHVQEEVLRLVASPPDDTWHCKLALGAGTSVGKTFVGGVIVNWFYDCRGPCIIPTTAPSQSSVVDLLWKEVRVQRLRAAPKWGIGPKDFIGPQAPVMKRAADWWAKGFVSQRQETWKGRHADNMCFLFDESPGIAQNYFDATKTMFQPGGHHLWICLYNPTDRASPLYQEIFHPESDWYITELSSLDHPNLLAELRGEPRPISAGVSLSQLEDAIKTDCEEVHPDEVTPRDFEWPPGSGRWFKPNAHAEWAYLGRWPTGDDDQLWSDALWKSVTKPITWEQVRIAAEEIPRIGCDAATGKPGSDKVEIHVSWGDYSVYHESKGQNNPMRTCGRLIEVAEEWAARCNESRAKVGMQSISGKQIPMMIDDDATGGAIASRLRELNYRVFPIGAATKARRSNRYPNKRSELWFDSAERARMGKMHHGLLPRKIVEELRRQVMAPTWENNSCGQRVIEEKERMRQRLGRSPDSADSCNLSFYVPNFSVPEIIQVTKATFQERMEETRQERTRSGPSFLGNSRRSGLFRRKS